jgi:hypothetical protein
MVSRWDDGLAVPTPAQRPQRGFVCGCTSNIPETPLAIGRRGNSEAEMRPAELFVNRHAWIRITNTDQTRTWIRETRADGRAPVGG